MAGRRRLRSDVRKHDTVSDIGACRHVSKVRQQVIVIAAKSCGLRPKACGSATGGQKDEMRWRSDTPVGQRMPART